MAQKTRKPIKAQAPEAFRWFQVPIVEIGKKTGLRFPQALARFERMPQVEALNGGAPTARLIRSARDFFA